MTNRSSTLTALIVVALALMALFFYPQIRAMHELIYGADRWFELFSNRLNWPSYWSRVAAVIFSMFTAFAWPAAGLLAYYVWRKPRAHKLVWPAIAFVLLFAGAPFLLAAFGASVCFAKDGTTDKWFVESPDHRITLYDSGGVDAYGNAKRRATPEICQRYALQQSGLYPARITYSSALRFFSGSGVALVWYYRASDGTIELYDRMGFHPSAREPLKPVTPEVVEQIQKQEVLRARTEAENVRLAAERAERERFKAALENVRVTGGTSIDCVRARTGVDLLICSDQSLAEMDRRMGTALGEVAGALDVIQRNNLYDAQTRWLNARNVDCSYQGKFKFDSPESDRVKRCLTEAFAQRIAAFQSSSSNGMSAFSNDNPPTNRAREIFPWSRNQ